MQVIQIPLPAVHHKKISTAHNSKTGAVLQKKKKIKKKLHISKDDLQNTRKIELELRIGEKKKKKGSNKDESFF